MFEFRLGRIPVRVRFGHFAFSAILAFLVVSNRGGGTSWPYSQLTTPGTAEYGAALLAVVAIWVGIVFVSALVHELGHAVAAAAYGYRPEIELVWMGGQTMPNANETIPWNKQVLLTLAGPAAGLALAAVAFLWLPVAAPGTPVRYVIANLLGANIVWAVLNLIPLLPLDGGHVALAVFMRFFGNRGFILSQLLGFAVAAAATLFAVSVREPIATVLFAMWGVRTLRMIAAFRRGQLEVQTVHPTELALRHARQLYEAGKYEEARVAARSLAEAGAAPSVHAQTHHLLGWIALKAGNGREALDHFSQVQGVPVEQKALAAGFSLIGDDARASSVWERAWAESPDATVLHEWAGALIRENRDREAERLPGADLARAYGCAQRVAFIRGDHLLAAEIGERLLARSPDAQAAYETACAFARAGRREDAYRMLDRAAELGYRDAAYARTDDDLGALHRDLRFYEWAERLEKAAR